MIVTIEHVKEIIKDFFELADDGITKKSNLEAHLTGVLWTVQTSQPSNREVIEWLQDYIRKIN